MPESSETKSSARGLFESLKRTFRIGPQQPGEAPAAAATLPVAPMEASSSLGMPASSAVVPALESTLSPTVAPEPAATATETFPQLVQESAPESAPAVAPGNDLPDWLSAQSTAEPVPAPESALPLAGAVEAPAAVEAPVSAPEAPSALPAARAPTGEVSAPVVTQEARVEDDPFATSREFNGYMETIRQAQAVLASGMALTPEEKKTALIAVAKSNSLLPKLPPEVLESVLLMRAVTSGNPKFGRDDFQREMLGAMDIIKTGTAVRG